MVWRRIQPVFLQVSAAEAPFCRFRWRLKRTLAPLGMWFKASCGVSYISALVRKASVSI